MTTAKFAENYVQNYFKKEKHIDLIKPPKGERGYDFRTRDSQLFIEVKGSATKDLTKILFRYFTNAEYEKAKECFANKIKYEVHLILGVNEEQSSHYIIPGKIFIERAKPEIYWSFPVRKDLKIFLLKK